MTITQTATAVKNLLETELPAFYGPADQLPTTGAGVTQCAVLWFTTGEERPRADQRGRHYRLETFRVIAVGRNQLECLAAVEKIRRALTGARLFDARIQETGLTNTEPATEPGTDPVRISTTLTYKLQVKP